MRPRILLPALCLSFLLAFSSPAAKAQPHPASATAPQQMTIPLSARIQPAQLAEMIHSGHAPTILQVGFTTLFEEAHIPGAIHAGPAVSGTGMALLRKTAVHLDRHKLLVIYCGCCPWPKCPNIRPAFEALRKMGFTNVKAVYIPHNFGADWVNHGYPTVKGA
ncbi:MAG: rhodanese-like domain-containing protein [Acidobacteriaceae bacterium]